MIETTTCTHQEEIEEAGDGIQYGICKICRQVRAYNTRDVHDMPKIIKLGRINGVIVLPGPKDIPELSTEEAAESEVARKAAAAAILSAGKDMQESPAETYVGKPRKQHGIRKWQTRCESCEFGYSHDELFFCSSKRCSQRCPPRLRPQYRPKVVEAKATTEITSELKVREYRRRFLEENKDAILRDYETLRLREFLAKWHISSGTWVKLRRAWGVPGKVVGRHKALVDKDKSPPGTKVDKGDHSGPPSIEQVTKALKTQITHDLPAFPAWEPAKWASGEIAVQWLRTYEALSRFELIGRLAALETKEPQRRPVKKRGWLTRLFRRR